jgi:cysteine synthase A
MNWGLSDVRITRDLVVGAALGLSLAISSASLAAYIQSRRQRRLREIEAEPEYPFRPIELRSDEIVQGVTGAIGNAVIAALSTRANRLFTECREYSAH